MNVTRKTEPQSEPVTLAEVKSHVRAEEFDQDDALLTSLIPVARRAVEDMTGRPLIDTVFLQTAREWRTSIGLLRGNGHSIESVKYDNASGVEQTVDDSFYDIFPYGDGCAACVFFDEFTEPDLVDRPFVDRIRIEFTAGYGSTGVEVPQPLRQAVLYLVQHFYDNPSPVGVNVNLSKMPLAVESLCGPYKIYN